MSSAEALADELERGESEVHVAGGGRNRTKAEQAEHKHSHPEGNTRRIVSNCQNGEERRKIQNSAK